MKPFNDTQSTDYGGNNPFTNFPRSRIHNPHTRPDFKKKYPSPRVPFRSQMCLLFQRGRCYYGENCHFAHTQSAIRKPGFAIGRQCTSVMSSDGVEIECNIFDDFNRVCKKDYLCRHWHRFGYCSYGNRCIFSHGKTDMPNTKLASQRNDKPSRQIGINVSATASWLPPTDKRWDVEKISRIYGDWIDDTFC